MRKIVWGGVAAVLLVAGTWAVGAPGLNGITAAPNVDARGERGGVSEGLIALMGPVAEGRQQLTVVDPRTRVIGVYSIDAASGVITLKSVRNFHYDLLMDEFNGAAPAPRDIRTLLQQR